MSTDGSSKSESSISSSSFIESTRGIESTHSGNNGSESSTPNSSGNSMFSSLIHQTECKPIAEVKMASQSNRVDRTFQLHATKQHADKPFGPRAKKSFPKPRFTVPQQVLGRDANNPEIEVVEYVKKATTGRDPKQGFRVSNLNRGKRIGNMVKLNEEVKSHPVKKEIPEYEETESCKPSQLLSNTLCEKKSDQAAVENELANMNTQSVVESNTTSPVIESEASLTVQSTPGPSSIEMVNGEEMAVTSTTTSHVLVGSSIDEQHKKSILASMKQAYSSDLDQSDKTAQSEKQVNLDDPTGMPALRALSPSIAIGNEEPSDTDAPKMPVLDMNADDSFDEELNRLVKKSRFGSPHSKMDCGTESQEDLFSESHSEPTEKVVVASVDGINKTPDPVRNNGDKPSCDVTDVHHPPTPAPTPQTDDLEAAMAALHGEPLVPDAAVTETAMTTIPLTNLAVLKVKRDQESINVSDHCVDSDSQPDSGNAEVTSDETETSKPPVKPYKFHKIGPKSRTMAKSISQAANLSPKAAVADDETKDETKDGPKPVVETKPHPRLSREVEKLCADEMVNNLLRSMEEQGSSRRRSAQAVVSYKEYQPNNKDKDSRASLRSRRFKEEEMFERESTPAKKKKKARTISVPSSIESFRQDRALQQWEALENSNNEDRVVYVPRKLVNVVASKIVQRRSFSSASSTDDNLNHKRRNLHAQDVVESASYALRKDHCYTTVKCETPEAGSSLRSTEDLAAKLSASCQEIHIRCKDHLLLVKLCPRTSKLRNSLNSSILKELSVLLRKLKMEPQIHVVLFTSAGSDFCTGVDFPSLIHDNMASRLEASISLVNCIQEFITELANSDKILVGGLVGSVIGLGVAILPYLDIVYACDKTTFYLPYVKLGQSSEGGIPLTFPSISKSLHNLLVNEGRRLTATQAKSLGLVDDVFLPDSFQEEMIPRVLNLANLYSQNSLPMKRMSRAALRRDLPAVVKEESQLLRQTWISEDFQRRAKLLVDSGDLLSA